MPKIRFVFEQKKIKKMKQNIYIKVKKVNIMSINFEFFDEKRVILVSGQFFSSD